MARVKLRFLLSLLALTFAAAAQTGLKTVNSGREGQPFTISDYLARGKMTVVEFSSRSCPKCRALEEKLSALAAANTKIAISRLEIDRPGSTGIDWQSPQARQYNLTSVPHFKVCDASGKLLAEGEPARKLVIKLLTESGLL